MADITKCEFDCPIKEHCYRYTAPEDIYQSYFAQNPSTLKDGVFSCDFFWGENIEQAFNLLKNIVK